MNTEANRKQMMINLIFKRFGALELDRKNTAAVMGVSTSTLARFKRDGVGPKWSKCNESRTTKVTYAIDDIAEYMVKKVSNQTVY